MNSSETSEPEYTIAYSTGGIYGERQEGYTVYKFVRCGDIGIDLPAGSGLLKTRREAEFWVAKALDESWKTKIGTESMHPAWWPRLRRWLSERCS